MTRRLRVAGLLVAAVTVASCGGGDGRAVHTGAPTTTTTTTITPVTRGSGGGSVNIGIICTTPTDAAHALVEAWRAGDRGAATRCGSPAAVATLFGRPTGADPNGGVEGWMVRCTGTVCSLSYPHGTARLTVRGSDAAGWIVDQVQLGS